MKMRSAVVIRYAVIGIAIGIVVAALAGRSLGGLLGALAGASLVMGALGAFAARRVPADEQVPAKRAAVLKGALALLAVVAVGVCLLLAHVHGRSGTQRRVDAGTEAAIQRAVQASEERSRRLLEASRASRPDWQSPAPSQQAPGANPNASPDASADGNANPR